MREGSSNKYQIHKIHKDQKEQFCESNKMQLQYNRNKMSFSPFSVWKNNCCFQCVIQRTSKDFRIEKLMASPLNKKLISTMTDICINAIYTRSQNHKPIFRFRDVKVQVESSNFTFRCNKYKDFALRSLQIKRKSFILFMIKAGVT